MIEAQIFSYNCKGMENMLGYRMKMKTSNSWTRWWWKKCRNR